MGEEVSGEVNEGSEDKIYLRNEERKQPLGGLVVSCGTWGDGSSSLSHAHAKHN